MTTEQKAEAAAREACAYEREHYGVISLGFPGPDERAELSALTAIILKHMASDEIIDENTCRDAAEWIILHGEPLLDISGYGSEEAATQDIAKAMFEVLGTKRTPLPKLPWPGPFKAVRCKGLDHRFAWYVQYGNGNSVYEPFHTKDEADFLCAVLNAAWEAEKGGK